MRRMSLRRTVLNQVAWIALVVVVILLGSSLASITLGDRDSGVVRAQGTNAGATAADSTSPTAGQDPGPALSPPGVQITLVLFNDSLVSGNFAAHWSTEPVAAAGDPASGYLFVASEVPGQISVVAVVVSVGVEVIATIPVPGGPMGVAYDSIDGSIYVTDSSAGTVLGINGTNLSVDTTVHVGNSPKGIVFDSHNGDLYVANSGSNNISVINGTTNATIGTGIPAGVNGAGSPAAIAFDNGTHQVFVADPS
jgi:YVTN family beta-propeller protein